LAVGANGNSGPEMKRNMFLDNVCTGLFLGQRISAHLMFVGVLAVMTLGRVGVAATEASKNNSQPASEYSINQDSKASEQFDIARDKMNKGDFIAAHKMLRTLGIQGHANAQDVLASMYIQGLGVKIDRQKAMQWYCALAHQPQGGRLVSRALWMLAEYFRTGGGLPSKRYKGKIRENEDPYRAYFWFEIMARQKNYFQEIYQDGEKLGNIGRYIVARQLEEAEIDQIKHFLQQWEPHEPVASLESCLALPQG
jgi:hypothetical protein